ncbi:MAG TPA: hypothetical protein DD791_02845 [Syntrophomonas sp.]|jgi:acyl-CoA hydrolase|nr:hypothetical protein [Syntrophomonas sp.]
MDPSECFNFGLGNSDNRGKELGIQSEMFCEPWYVCMKEGNVRSRIVGMFPMGTVVTTSRNDVEWVVTEYGAIRLTNKPVSKRVKSLIGIAHPDFRDELNFMARKQLWIR